MKKVLSTFIVFFLLTLYTHAQEPQKIPRIGFLAPQGRSLPLYEAFDQGLAESGYKEGRNVIIESRFAEGHYEKFPDLLGELVRQKVDVIAVTGAVTARAAMKAVKDLPIVFSVVVDPVADNVVQSFERPGGNITGVTCFDPQQARRQFELLREILPGLRRVAILGDQGVSEALIKAAEANALDLGLQPQPIRVKGPNPDFDGAFKAIRQGKAEALLVLEEPVLGIHPEKIAELAANSRLPTVFAPSRVAAGGLISYGTSQVEAVRRLAVYVDKILKGSKPGDLPVEKVLKYELIVNMKTAREIGVTIPPDVLKRADRIIQ